MNKIQSAAILCAAAAFVASTPVSAEQPVFSDGFECGFVYAWSGSIPAAPARLTLTFPPANLASVSEVVPLGSVYPGSQHVIPVDHMYLGYLMPDGGGVSSVAVQTMAAGHVTMISRTVGADRTDYEIFIVHADGMTTQYDHLHDLSPTILDHVDGFWFEPVAGSGSEAVLLGQLGGPAPLAVAAGQAIGTSRNFNHNWDVGFIDACRTTLPVNPSPRRYPDIPDYVGVLGLALEHPPFPGHRTFNGACFIDYLEPSIRPSWEALLASTPQGCGQAIWDIDGTLQGTWFNPAVDTGPDTVMFEVENAALVLVPYNLAPTTSVRIAFGSNHSLALLSPGPNPAAVAGFLVDFDATPGAVVDPHPASVTAGAQVCYDLERLILPGAWDRLFLEIQGNGSLRARFEVIGSGTPTCPTSPSIVWTESDPTFIR